MTVYQSRYRCRTVRLTTALEVEVEEFLDEVFERDYFRNYVIDGREIELRMPFGINFGRSLPSWSHAVFRGGKASRDRESLITVNATASNRTNIEKSERLLTG